MSTDDREASEVRELVVNGEELPEDFDVRQLLSNGDELPPEAIELVRDILACEGAYWVHFDWFGDLEDFRVNVGFTEDVRCNAVLSEVAQEYKLLPWYISFDHRTITYVPEDRFEYVYDEVGPK